MRIFVILANLPLESSQNHLTGKDRCLLGKRVSLYYFYLPFTTHKNLPRKSKVFLRNNNYLPTRKSTTKDDTDLANDENENDDDDDATRLNLTENASFT